MTLSSLVLLAVIVSPRPLTVGAVCHDTYSAHRGVEHDDMNVLGLGRRIRVSDSGERFASRGEEEFKNRVLSPTRFGFGGHVEKK
jgi:hypothetical protein